MVTGHRRSAVDTDPTRPGNYLVGCSCGWWADALASKRAAYRAHLEHLDDVAPLEVDLDTPQGRGRAAQLAHARAVIVLTRQHPDELLELENAERTRLGLRPFPPRQDRTA